MKPSEIVKKAAEKNGIDPARAVLTMGVKIRNEGLAPIQNKDSLMLFKPLGNGVGAAYFITADSPLNAISSFKHFHRLLEKQGIHSVFLASQNSSMLSSLQHSGFNISRSNSEKYPLVATL